MNQLDVGEAERPVFVALKSDEGGDASQLFCDARPGLFGSESGSASVIGLGPLFEARK
jgi:hypothetical protein